MKAATHGTDVGRSRVKGIDCSAPDCQRWKPKSILTFHSPFALSADSIVGPAHTKPAHCPKIYQHACGNVVRRVHVASIKDELGYLTDQLWYRRLLTPMAPKALKEARCCQLVWKLLFPFARAPAKCGKNGPSIHVHWGIRARQTPKVLPILSSFVRAGETTIALKMGWKDKSSPK